MGPNLICLLPCSKASPLGHWVMMKERTVFIADVMQGERDHFCSKVQCLWMALGEGFSKAECRRGSQGEGLAFAVHASDWLVGR